MFQQLSFGMKQYIATIHVNQLEQFLLGSKQLENVSSNNPY